MTREEIIQAISDDKMMPFIQPDQLAEIVDFVIKNYKPSLPSNIDEAAEDGWALYEYRESPKGLYSTCYIDGFKSGAEWMAGQGETVEGYIAGTNEVAAILAIPRKEHNKGDKVVVQIRKK